MARRDRQGSSEAPAREQRAPLARETVTRGSARDSSKASKPTHSAIECMQHDARSAAHALSGFLELLQSDALGVLSDEQRRALKHMETAAERMAEITESALEFADAKRPLRPYEVSRTCLVHVTEHVLYAASRAQPNISISFAADDGIRELHVQMEHQRLRKLLQLVLDVARSTSPERIDVRISRTDLHASLVLSARAEESSKLSHVPSKNATSTDLEAMAAAWSNRDYVRLKRLESLLLRHKGRLLVARDLTRMRVMLPLGH
jgi:signal transduction histidine kinase